MIKITFKIRVPGRVGLSPDVINIIGLATEEDEDFELQPVAVPRVIKDLNIIDILNLHSNGIQVEFQIMEEIPKLYELISKLIEVSKVKSVNAGFSDEIISALYNLADNLLERFPERLRGYFYYKKYPKGLSRYSGDVQYKDFKIKRLER